jgi:pentatricopeptide repeat protein
LWQEEKVELRALFGIALRLMLRRIVREKKGILFCARRHASADSALRAQPWAFNDNTAAFQKTQIRTTAARFNLDMAAKANIGAPGACFGLAAEMKLQGITPNITTYNTLLSALAQGAHAPAALAVLEDMLAVGVSPDTTSFNHIIDVDIIFCAAPSLIPSSRPIELKGLRSYPSFGQEWRCLG